MEVMYWDRTLRVGAVSGKFHGAQKYLCARCGKQKAWDHPLSAAGFLEWPKGNLIRNIPFSGHICRPCYRKDGINRRRRERYWLNKIKKDYPDKYEKMMRGEEI